MNQALHRARTHQRIEAFFAEVLAQHIGKSDIDFLVGQLRFKLQEELVDHPQDDIFVQRLEADGGIQPVAELGREQAFDVRLLVTRLTRVGKADRGLVHGLGARIGGHHDDDVAEIRLAAIVVSQGAVVHDLQQHVEDGRVGLLDLIEQQHAMGLFGDGLGQQTTLVKTNVAGRRANQAADGMLLHVFAHVETNQLDTHDVGQLFGGFGLANASGATEQEGADGLVAFAQS